MSIYSLNDDIFIHTLNFLDAPTLALCKFVSKEFCRAAYIILPSKVDEMMASSVYQRPSANGLTFFPPLQRDFQIISMPLIRPYWANISNNLFLNIFPKLKLSIPENKHAEVRQQREKILDELKTPLELQKEIDTFIQNCDMIKIAHCIDWALVHSTSFLPTPMQLQSIHSCPFHKFI